MPSPRLLGPNRGTLTDWIDFQNRVLPGWQTKIRQTFHEFSREASAPQNQEVLERKWKQRLKENLAWVTSKLRSADEELKAMEHHTFAAIDIRIFDTHREQMVNILRKGNQLTYALGLKLQRLYDQRDLLRDPARHRQCVHLVKRIAQDGYVYFGVAPSPVNQTDNPDPNSDLNEVHIPVSNIGNPF
jgi:hypothetical protein